MIAGWIFCSLLMVCTKDGNFPASYATLPERRCFFGEDVDICWKGESAYIRYLGRIGKVLWS